MASQTCLSLTAAEAAIKPNALFSDNAVLQQGVKLPVWGTTDSNDKVTVSLAGQEVSAEPKDGRWQVELAPLLADGNPLDMSIRQGDQKITLKNVLVGDVWVCGGQSNMEWQLRQSVGALRLLPPPTTIKSACSACRDRERNNH